MPLFKKSPANGRPLVQLSDVHLRVLRRCRMILVKDLDPLDVLNSLTAEDGFRQDVKDSVLNLGSSDKQVVAILDHLETQTDDTFGSFLDVLREQYKHLHRVLVETSRTLDETDDDRTRERAAMVGDSVRKLLRDTARHQLNDRLRRGSGEFLGDYYIDNLRSDGEDAGQYIDCYVIPTRGKLQKEKWIKHVTLSEDQTSATVARVPRVSLEVILTCDLAFTLINRCDIPREVEQPPKTVTSIYGVKQKTNEEKSDIAKEPASDLSPRQNEYRTKPMERSRKCPPPLPPKPDILSLSGKKLLKCFSLPQGNLSDLEKMTEVPNFDVKITPPLLISDAHDTVEKRLAASPSEQKVADFSAPPLPVRKSVERSDDVRQVACSTDEKIRDLTEVKIMSTPPLPIRRRQLTPPESTDHKTTSCAEQEVLENGAKSTAELSGDEDDDDDVSSLNFDVGIQDQDDVTSDVTSPTKIRDASSLNIGMNGKKIRQASPVSDDIALPVGGLGAFQVDGKQVEEFGLDESIPVDMLGSFEGSHYEEIEPHGDGFSFTSTLYLDPRSDKSFNRQSTRRHRDHRNGGMSAFTLNQLKTFDSPDRMVLTKGTFLIAKSKQGVSAPNTDFDKTYLCYDSMGLAYYVPIASVKEYGDPRSEKWFYPIEMTAKEATLFLNSVDQRGCFIVCRPSDRHDPLLCYRLSVSLGGGVVLHYDVIENVHGDVMIRGHDHSFMNVCDLVEYFRKNQSSLATRLRRPLREACLPVAPGHHYSPRFEIQRRDITLSSVVVDRGVFGEYCLGVFRGISVRVSVMKTEPSATNDDDFLEEGLTMMMMEHENIIRLLGVSCCVRPFYVVMEHIERGTLAECLQHRVIPSDNIDSLFAICIQLVAAMSYLESLAFMLHRGLSSQSFYVTADLSVKLGKFDRARHVVDDNYKAPSSEEVMIRWAAPEVLLTSTYSTKSDVWSLGVVLWEVFSQGACPYASCGAEQVVLYVTEGGKLEKPPGCAPDLWSMMKNCWKQRPGDRPTFAALQDKIKGKSSIYYVSPVRSNPNMKNPVVMENGKPNGSVPSKSRSSLQIRSPGSGSKTSAGAAFEAYKGSGSMDSRKKRSKSATRGMLDRIDVPDPGVRNGHDRAQTPSSDSSSIISASVLNDSCDDLDRGQKSRKSWKKLLK